MTGTWARIRNSAKAIIIRDDAILLQRCQFGGEIVHLLPGGTQEHGETLEEAVRREVWEEAGMRVRVERLLWVREFIAARHDRPDDDGHTVEHLFHCIPEEGEAIGEPTVPDDIQLAILWVPLSELPTLKMWPATVQHFLTPGFDPATVLLHYLGDCL